MTYRHSTARRGHGQAQRPALEFFALTFLVVAVAFTAGTVIRKNQLAGDIGQAVQLMRIDRGSAPAATPHRLATAAGPQEWDIDPQLEHGTDAWSAPIEEQPPSLPISVAEAPATANRVPAPSEPTFDGRPLRKAKTIRMLVTAYSPDARSCGVHADGITASGYSVWTNGMRLVAADRKVLPFGALVSVPGYDGGKPVPVLDRGGAIKGNRLDVLYPTHETAVRWGKQWLTVTVWEYAD